MLILVVGILAAVVPVVYYFVRDRRLNTPSIHWPKLAPALKLEFQENPPRMTGRWNGRAVAVTQDGAVIKIAALLAKPSRLRVEVGPKAEVARRAGVLVPDAVATGDAAFEERLLARCSDKPAGLRLFDQNVRQRVIEQPVVEILSEPTFVAWRIPYATNPDQLEPILEVLTLIADEMEAHS